MIVGCYDKGGSGCAKYKSKCSSTSMYVKFNDGDWDTVANWCPKTCDTCGSSGSTGGTDGENVNLFFTLTLLFHFNIIFLASSSAQGQLVVDPVVWYWYERGGAPPRKV